MILSLIVAKAKNNVIGIENRLPWRLSEDLKFFKKTTIGHTVIMGRKTYESIGKPLPKRTMVVLTNQKDYRAEGCHVVHSLEEAIRVAQAGGETEAFVIGGATLYQWALPQVDKIYLTHVDTELKGDTFFPEWEVEEWSQLGSSRFQRNEKNDFDFEICVYERVDTA